MVVYRPRHFLACELFFVYSLVAGSVFIFGGFFVVKAFLMFGLESMCNEHE